MISKEFFNWSQSRVSRWRTLSGSGSYHKVRLVGEVDIYKKRGLINLISDRLIGPMGAMGEKVL